MTTQQFVDIIKELVNSNDLVYAWGADGQQITPETMDALYALCGDPHKHTKDYYRSKAIYNRGSRCADEAGLLNMITGFGFTAYQYDEKSRPYRLALPPAETDSTQVVLLFGCSGKIGVYLGDQTMVEMRESDGLSVRRYSPNGWSYCALPFFCDDINISTNASASISLYQQWLNGKFDSRVDITGEYDDATKRASIQALKVCHNELVRGDLEINSDFTAGVRDKMCTDLEYFRSTHSISRRRADEYSTTVTIIGNMRIFTLNSPVSIGDLFAPSTYVITYQQSTRGLEVTGSFDVITLYRLFNTEE